MPSLSSYLIEGANYSTTNNLSPSDREKCTGTLFISTRPPISDVFFDGKYIGKTNISPVKVIPGTHVLLVVKGKKYWKKQLVLTEGQNEAIKIYWSDIQNVIK